MIASKPCRLMALTYGVLLAVTGAPTPVAAQGLTAGRLYELCHDQTSPEWKEIGQWVCPAYIRGIIDGARLQAFHATGSTDTCKSVMQFCEPPGTSMEEAIDVVVRFIEARPESRPLTAAATVYEAFSTKWPCQR